MESNLSSSENVRAKIRRPSRGKPGGESARNLLGNLLDDSAAAAEEERLRREADQKRAEEEARLQREHEEEMAKLEAERALIAERQAQEEMRLHQAELQAQVQREKDIEAGLIDLEEEARQKREEEARKRAEEEARIKKETELREANERKRTQEAELEALRQEKMVRDTAPKKNPFILPACLAALVLFSIGIGYYLLAVKPENERIQAVTEGYSISKQYPTQDIMFLADNDAMKAETLSLVKQAPDPKPSAKKKRPTNTTSGPAEPVKKPTLTGGSLFGKGKL